VYVFEAANNVRYCTSDRDIVIRWFEQKFHCDSEGPEFVKLLNKGLFGNTVTVVKDGEYINISGLTRCPHREFTYVPFDDTTAFSADAVIEKRGEKFYYYRSKECTEIKYDVEYIFRFCKELSLVEVDSASFEMLDGVMLGITLGDHEIATKINSMI
jgi:hypothetical protein